MKERIRQIMEQAKLSQQDFAAKLGISPASLSSIFTGRTNPTNNHVMAVHRAFPDISINWLMFGEGDAHVSAGSSFSGEESGDGVVASENFNGGTRDENSPHSVIAGLGISSAAGSPVQEETPNLFSGSNGSQKRSPENILARGSHNPSSWGGTVAKDVRGARGGSSSSYDSVNFIDRPVRKIKEIRVFFDDGTYEAFVPASK